MGPWFIHENACSCWVDENPNAGPGETVQGPIYDYSQALAACGATNLKSGHFTCPGQG